MKSDLLFLHLDIAQFGLRVRKSPSADAVET